MAFEAPAVQLDRSEYKAQVSGNGLWQVYLTWYGDYNLADGETFSQDLISYMASRGYTVSASRTYPTSQPITP